MSHRGPRTPEQRARLAAAHSRALQATLPDGSTVFFRKPAAADAVYLVVTPAGPVDITHSLFRLVPRQPSGPAMVAALAHHIGRTLHARPLRPLDAASE